jgi:hypothetical protein
LAARASFFFWSALLTWTFFWVVFFWLAFGDLSPMVFAFLSALTQLWLVSFSAVLAILAAATVKVNAAGKIIWRARRQDAEVQSLVERRRQTPLPFQ